MSGLSDAALASLREALADAEAGARYEVLDLVGEGGMGEVYRARDRELSREVALKVVRGAPGEAARLRREARILASLEHPGIVPVHDAGLLPDGRAYYAMKLVRGARLDDWLRREAPPLGERLRLFERLCETVAFAHAAGVIHRDLKPANVMVGAFGEVLVLDWGVAKVVANASATASGEAQAAPADASGERVQTAHGTVLGTPGYMAPEQARGDVSLVDARSDVYALGALLADLLDGARGAPGFDRLSAVAAKARSEDPAARYASASELGADVARFRTGLAVVAYPEALHERLARLARRHRWWLALVLAYLATRALLLLVGGR